MFVGQSRFNQRSRTSDGYILNEKICHRYLTICNCGKRVRYRVIEFMYDATAWSLPSMSLGKEDNIKWGRTRLSWKQQQQWEPRTAWNLCQFLLTLTLKVCLSRPFITELNTYTWSGRQNRWRQYPREGSFRPEHCLTTPSATADKTMCVSHTRAFISLPPFISHTGNPSLVHPDGKHRSRNSRKWSLA